ncbi:MAG: electron transfer flavoprotein subunit beta/FixA family protein [Clostridiaceae bacterium]|nr:electron transfer flavoprotein subunit beta/FixA family protein [Clostridiaceae bacterium]
MKIIVCMKQVPDTNEVRINPETGTLMREGVPSIMNPDDKAALEAALRIKDASGARVIGLSMGPRQAEAVLREALAMGADECYLLTDRAFGGADTWATSSTLAAAIKQIGCDLVLTGRQAIDGDTAQVGPGIAEHLSIPNLSYAEDIRVDGKDVVVRQQYDESIHTVRAGMPALVTVLSELNEPRYMTPGGIFDAYRENNLRVWGRDDLEIEDENIGLKGSPTRVAKSFPKSVKAPGMTINAGADESVQFIVDKLKEKYIL